MRWSWGICVPLLLVACHAASNPPPVPASESATKPVGVTEPQSRVLSGDVHLPDGFTVPPGETWVFDPDTDTTVTVSANVIVEGTRVMRPASGDIEHVLIFEDVDESRFVGGGMDPVESHVGLWGIGDGQRLIEGREKTP